MKTMTILNMLARSTMGVVSTVVGATVGRKVADHHSTEAAVAAASAATLVTYVAANEVYNNLQYIMIQQKPEDDQNEFTDEPTDDNADEGEETSSEDTAADTGDQIEEVDGNSFPSLLTLEFSDTTEELVDKSNTFADEENELKVKARHLLKMTGGEPSKANVVNTGLLKVCIDSILSEPEFYNVRVYEDDERVHLSGPWVDLVEEIANNVLICVGGECDYEAHSELKKLSSGKYFVTAGEVDSFGWLSGVINTPVGVIVY